VLDKTALAKMSKICYNITMETLSKIALFWDVDRSTLSVDTHADFIIRRILAQGDMDDARFMLTTYGETKVKETLLSMRGLDKKSLNFWTNRLVHA